MQEKDQVIMENKKLWWKGSKNFHKYGINQIPLQGKALWLAGGNWMVLLAKTSAFSLPEPNVGGDPAEGDAFSTSVKVTKETCIFRTKGLQGTSGVKTNDKIIIIVEWNKRKGEENST